MKGGVAWGSPSSFSLPSCRGSSVVAEVEEGEEKDPMQEREEEEAAGEEFFPSFLVRGF